MHEMLGKNTHDKTKKDFMIIIYLIFFRKCLVSLTQNKNPLIVVTPRNCVRTWEKKPSFFIYI